MATYVPNQLYQVPLAQLQPDPAQPRKYMEPAALQEMTEEDRTMLIDSMNALKELLEPAITRAVANRPRPA